MGSVIAASHSFKAAHAVFGSKSEAINCTTYGPYSLINATHLKKYLENYLYEYENKKNKIEVFFLIF